jgi:superoxide dismutase, Cu-Zn family
MRGLTGSDQKYTAGLARGSSVHPVRRSMHPRLAIAGVVVVAALMPTACENRGISMPPTSAVVLHGEGALTAPSPSSNADTYNTALAPVGARLTATMTPSGDSTNAELTVSGMLPNRGYAAHAHAFACSVDPESAGPHYQNRVDPAATHQNPSTSPEYANPRNEIWLDFHTDASGSATSPTTVPFVFTGRGPGSIVVHEAEHTATAPGHAGQAGPRIACLTLSAVGRKAFNPF